MGFGAHFPARRWDGEQTLEAIRREVDRSWKVLSLGDMAIGLWEGNRQDYGRLMQPIVGCPSTVDVRLVEKDAFRELHSEGRLWNDVKWIGYAGVRNAKTTSMPETVRADSSLPPWQEMVELRYGISPTFWGSGFACEAAQSLMQWAAAERGVRRFIAETERPNSRSAAVLRKLAFVESGTNYWREPSEVEWEMVV